jgi:Zn-dependent protease with chaperone function
VIAALFLPLIVATVFAVVTSVAHRRMPPRVASKSIVLSLGAVLVGALPTVWLVAARFLAEVPLVRGGFAWCADVFGLHHPVPPLLGGFAVVLSMVGGVRAMRCLDGWRTARLTTPGPVLLADDERVYACTLPGVGGRIVMSTGLDALLDRRERAVVLAHERAHARFRHDRYLLVADLSAAVLPLLTPLARRLRFCLERWADEEAVAACGDRRFVAETLGKVAMTGMVPAGLLGFGGLGVTGRVSALLSPSPIPLATTGRIWAAAAVSAAMVFSTFQLHHVWMVIAAICSP